MAWVCHLCGDDVVDADGTLLDGPYLTFRPPKRWDPSLYVHEACVRALLQWNDMGCPAPGDGTLMDRLISQDSWSLYGMFSEPNRCLQCKESSGAEPCLRLDRGYARPYDQRWVDIHLNCLRELVGGSANRPLPIPGFLDAMEQLRSVDFSNVG